MGCDGRIRGEEERDIGISIHAPTWGATFIAWKSFRAKAFQSTHPRGVRRKQVWQSSGSWNFNPRTHVGCDTAVEVCRHRRQLFQSTHPRGVRRRGRHGSRARPDFNPRTHVGCDKALRKSPLWGLISIHAPTWGATNFVTEMLSATNISIHAPTWGATFTNAFEGYGGLIISIHAPTWGATEASMAVLRELEFQSTHPRGVRHGRRSLSP